MANGIVGSSAASEKEEGGNGRNAVDRDHRLARVRTEWALLSFFFSVNGVGRSNLRYYFSHGQCARFTLPAFFRTLLVNGE